MKISFRPRPSIRVSIYSALTFFGSAIIILSGAAIIWLNLHKPEESMAIVNEKYKVIEVQDQAYTNEMHVSAPFIKPIVQSDTNAILVRKLKENVQPLNLLNN
ncbi:MAG: hypothetical protein DWQ44_08810 [Bacteroidetes bacterium]|nr:MAG: hypothetical protein DWQ33_02215 [Bacteroidota bacterium]REK06930.1 MAG: hypothetical protein DWQ39_01880 [Bacteroidota bacterium]REK33723.1 MAG: hypothetical protein DWQ44_08810 [Bacteroidota bacterium]REK49394.1 MAG: hypothetical protein DWQ48_07520 [Bacteroidota bacterium]